MKGGMKAMAIYFDKLIQAHEAHNPNSNHSDLIGVAALLCPCKENSNLLGFRLNLIDLLIDTAQ